MTLTAIALDPGFLFSFRTQFYICLLPLALLMSSIAFTECARQKQSLAFLLLSGVLAGLAGYGYFIYFFSYTCGIRVCRFDVTSFATPRPRRSRFGYRGVAIGLSPYLIGELLIIHALGGLRPWLQFLTENLSGLAPVAGHFQLLDRLGWFAWLTSQTLMSSGPLLMMLGEFNVPFIPPTLKLVLLVAHDLRRDCRHDREPNPGPTSGPGPCHMHLPDAGLFGSGARFRSQALAASRDCRSAGSLRGGWRYLAPRCRNPRVAPGLRLRSYRCSCWLFPMSSRRSVSMPGCRLRAASAWLRMRLFISTKILDRIRDLASSCFPTGACFRRSSW